MGWRTGSGARPARWTRSSTRSARATCSWPLSSVWSRPASTRWRLVLGAFAEELQADVPQLVAAVHVAGIGAGEFLWVEAGACLFHYHVGDSLVARLEQPGVVGQPLVCLAVPADAGRGLEFVDGAVDVRAEGDPVERDADAEEPAGDVDGDVAGVGVPVRPDGGVDEMLPDLSRWRGDHDVVVGEEVGLLGHDALRPVDVRRAALDVLND